MALTVDQLYELILNRQADPGGRQFWQEYTSSRGTPGIDPEELDAFISGAQSAGERVNSSGTQQALGMLSGNTVTASDPAAEPATKAEAKDIPARYTNIEVVKAPTADADQSQEPDKYFATDSETGDRVELLKASEYPVGTGPSGTEWLARRAGDMITTSDGRFLPFEAVDSKGNIIGTWNMQKNELSDFAKTVGTATKIAAIVGSGYALGSAAGLFDGSLIGAESFFAPNAASTGGAAAADAGITTGGTGAGFTGAATTGTGAAGTSGTGAGSSLGGGLKAGADAGTNLGVSGGATNGVAGGVSGGTGLTVGAGGTGAGLTAGTGLLTNTAATGATNAVTNAATNTATNSVLSQLFGQQGLTGLLSGLAGTAIDYTKLQALADEASKTGQSLYDIAAKSGQGAGVPFTPYTVTTGSGSVAFGTGADRGEPTLTVSSSPEYQALRNQALAQAGTALGAINPADSAQALYDRARLLADPTDRRQQEQLLSSLGARGLLGIGRNLPTVGGTTTAVNPFVESLLSAQRTADANLALQAQQFGTQEAMRQQQLSQGLLGQAQGIDVAAQQVLNPSLQFGQATLGAEQQAARNRLQAELAGLALQAPFEAQGYQARQQGITGVANLGRGLFGLPTTPGNTASTNIIGNLVNYGFKELFGG